MESQNHATISRDQTDNLTGVREKNLPGKLEARQSGTLDDYPTNFPIHNEIQTPKSQNTRPVQDKEKNNQESRHVFQKRPGTTGICGQLYETKLLTLLLLRALNNDNIKEFVLGTNIIDLGEMDDIVFKYKTNNSQKSKIVFIQAKHRDDPTRETLTLEEILKPNGDFSFQKYFESYLKIEKIINSSDNDLMFQDNKDIECEYVIYTSGAENFSKKKILEYSDTEFLIKSGSNGKIFQFQYDNQDIEGLLANVTKSRIILLAKSIVKNILKGNFRHVMNNDAIKEYHVFLAQNVIVIENKEITEQLGAMCGKDRENCYCTGRFRESFLSSSDENSLLMKRVLCEELCDAKRNSQVPVRDEVDTKLKSLSFKLPVNFGNQNFRFYGSDRKQQRRFDHMCSIFKKLLEHYCKENLNYTYVELDENSVGLDKTIQLKDLGTYWIGGLVGNLLIIDHATKALMFNLNEECLSSENIKILKWLKENYALCKFRFHINIYGFPKLTLDSTEYDRKLICDFLNKLKFYTNQAKEDEVENVIKKEIKSYYLQQKPTNPLCHYKYDLIYLKVHDEIQKWWKQPNTACYLTKTCKFYLEAQREILESPVINILDYMYRKEMENILVQFNNETIESISLDKFLNGDEKLSIIFSNEINFTSVKVIQYFDAINKSKDCIFIDLESIIIKNSLESLKHDIQFLSNPVLVVSSQEQTVIDSLYNKLKQFITYFKGKIIIITHVILEDKLKMMFPGNIIQKDIKNTFSTLSSEIQRIIFEERKVTFQGIEFIVDTVFDHTVLDLLNPDLLRKLLHTGNIEIGRSLTDSVYYKTIDFYTHRRPWRYITLNSDKYKDEFRYLPDQFGTESTPQHINDIVITTDSPSVFEETCKCNSNSNVHWFEKRTEHPNIIWKQSHGSLQTLVKYVDRRSYKDYRPEVKTLKDIKEKVVIINAGPGMGKSTLLSHLAMNTKRLYPNIWILKINLLDNISQFSDWKKEVTHIGLIEAIKFIYNSTITSNDMMNSNNLKTHLSKLISYNDNEIHFTDYDVKDLTGIETSEMKLLNHFYNNNCLAVLFDGFDEISPDYSKEVIELLCSLKNSKIAHLWLTSRPCNMLDQLELALGTFSFNLNSLTILEQKLVLQNIWTKALGYQPNYISVHQFYDITMNKYTDNSGNQFSSLPLHLYMIAEVFEKCFRGFLARNISLREFRDTSNLITLYERFTNTKFFDIRFGKKKHSLNLKDPILKKMVEKELKIFMKNHKITAAYLLLDKTIVLFEHDLTEVQMFIDNLKLSDEKSEIIECIVSGHPKFVHYTFAEYFAVEHIFEKLRSVHVTRSMWEYFLDQLLRNDQFMGIRSFINSKLEINPHIITEFQCTNAFENVFNICFNQYEFCSTKQKTALSVAFDEKLDEIVIFLLKCAKPFLNEHNVCDFIELIQADRYCVFCAAIKSHKQIILKCFIELITDIDRNLLRILFSCQLEMRCDPAFQSLSVTDTALNLSMLGNIDCDVLFEVLTLKYKQQVTPAHSLGAHGYQIKYIFSYLQNLSREQLVTIFSVTDVNGQTPIHYAAIENDYDFLTSVYKLLGKEDFRKVCTIPNIYGFTPICMFGYNKDHFDQLKTILDIIYDDPEMGVQDFVFNKLPKLYPKEIENFPKMTRVIYFYNPFKSNRDFVDTRVKTRRKTPIGVVAACLGY